MAGRAGAPGDRAGWIAAVSTRGRRLRVARRPVHRSPASAWALFFAPVANVVLSSVRPEEEGQASGANERDPRARRRLRRRGARLDVRAHGRLRPPAQTFSDGLAPALWIGAGAVLVGAVLALLIPRGTGRRVVGRDGRRAGGGGLARPQLDARVRERARRSLPLAGGVARSTRRRARRQAGDEVLVLDGDGRGRRAARRGRRSRSFQRCRSGGRSDAVRASPRSRSRLPEPVRLVGAMDDRARRRARRAARTPPAPPRARARRPSDRGSGFAASARNPRSEPMWWTPPSSHGASASSSSDPLGLELPRPLRRRTGRDDHTMLPAVRQRRHGPAPGPGASPPSRSATAGRRATRAASARIAAPPPSSGPARAASSSSSSSFQHDVAVGRDDEVELVIDVS